MTQAGAAGLRQRRIITLLLFHRSFPFRQLAAPLSVRKGDFSFNVAENIQLLTFT